MKVRPICGRQRRLSYGEQALTFYFNLPPLVSNEAARGIVKRLTQHALLIENFTKRLTEGLKARCSFAAFSCYIVDYPGACRIRHSFPIEQKVLFWMIILVQEGTEIIDDFCKKLVIGPFGAAKYVTFLFEDTQKLFNIVMVATQQLNYCPHVQPHIIR